MNGVTDEDVLAAIALIEAMPIDYFPAPEREALRIVVRDRPADS